MKPNELCPCSSKKAYAECCGLFISGENSPSTPEELMRSRYTAYVQANMEYIARTMKSPAADHFNIEASRAWAKKVKWAGLEVVEATQDANKGIVEFCAYYAEDNKKEVLHEISEFLFENGKWYYLNGIYPSPEKTPSAPSKIGRNDPCSCGSSKKYKKCCGI